MGNRSYIVSEYWRNNDKEIGSHIEGRSKMKLHCKAIIYSEAVLEYEAQLMQKKLFKAE